LTNLQFYNGGDASSSQSSSIIASNTQETIANAESLESAALYQRTRRCCSQPREWQFDEAEKSAKDKMSLHTIYYEYETGYQKSQAFFSPLSLC